MSSVRSHRSRRRRALLQRIREQHAAHVAAPCPVVNASEVGEKLKGRRAERSSEAAMIKGRVSRAHNVRQENSIYWNTRRAGLPGRYV
mmetsp:Transcript_6724/g.21180  ORF Transcript_6724/g.21180 Transcript_6724/m.21180 type:complete len:88 (-) Transcript_6724:817-1080(-)